MPSRMPLSVHVLTFNSGKTLRRALESVKEAAEILIIDGGSTDDTIAIAKEFDAKIIPQRETEQGTSLLDFAGARNRGLHFATQPWILAFDSDEYASPTLMKEIRDITQKNNIGAYAIPRKYVLASGAIVEHATTYPNRRVYFFHKDAALQWIKPVHERIQLQDGVVVENLTGASLAPLGTIAEYKEKNLRYLEIEKEKSTESTWGFWLVHKLLRTVRSRIIATIKLLWIWLVPHAGKRLPFSQEMVRFWYAWKLIWITMPKRK